MPNEGNNNSRTAEIGATGATRSKNTPALIAYVSDITISILLGIGCLVGCLLWFVATWAYLGLFSWGDGGGGSGVDIDEGRPYFLPSLYLLIIAVSCLPFFRYRLFAIIGVIAHGILAWSFWILFHSQRYNPTFVICLLVPFIFVVIGWSILCGLRFRTGISNPPS